MCGGPQRISGFRSPGAYGLASEMISRLRPTSWRTRRSAANVCDRLPGARGIALWRHQTTVLASACCLRNCRRRPTRSTSVALWRPFSVCRGRRQRNFLCNALDWTVANGRCGRLPALRSRRAAGPPTSNRTSRATGLASPSAAMAGPTSRPSLFAPVSVTGPAGSRPDAVGAFARCHRLTR